MNIEDKEPTETQSDFDMDAATADISSELFGQGDEEGKVEPIEGEEEKLSEGDSGADDVVTSPPQEKEGGDQAAEGEVAENSDEVQEVGAPKTWTKEALETWATIPDRAKQEILKREEDFLSGITQYKSMAEKGQAYESVITPYAPILAAENIDPVQMFQSFAANHYLLSRGTPAQKSQIAAGLFKSYDIPLADFLNLVASEDGDQPREDPAVAALRKELDEIKTGINTTQQRDQEAIIAERRKEIDAFAADPAHPHFNELADDIRKLFEAGLANTLPEAYEKALYANPSTRKKEIDRLTAERTSASEEEKNKRKVKVASSQGDHVRTTPKTRDGTVPQGSMDDTLNETLAAIQSRG